MRRVVVTGMGMVTPLGVGVDHNWSKIIAGNSGISQITNFDVSDISCQIAGQVPDAGVEGGLQMDDFVDPRDQRKQDRFIQLGMVAAIEAVENSGWMPEDRESQITISLTDTQTAALESGRYVYDLVITDASGSKTRVVEGIATVSPSVSR